MYESPLDRRTRNWNFLQISYFYSSVVKIFVHSSDMAEYQETEQENVQQENDEHSKK
jgi:hypothetical protein